MDTSPHNCFITKRGKYITITLRPMNGDPTVAGQFTFHQVELKKLIPLLERSVSSSVGDSEEMDFGFQEGAFLGAPETGQS